MIGGNKYKSNSLLLARQILEARRDFSSDGCERLKEIITGYYQPVEEASNQAFVDGQNLYYGTAQAEHPWKISLERFREYLYRKYKVSKAYYFLGYYDENNKSLYKSIFDAGYNLIFRAHNDKLASKKKGNVDTDIVFMMMRNYCEDDSVGKMFLVSGDGDYFKAAKYLMRKEKLGKILFPSKRKASSLYQEFANIYYEYLDKPELKEKLRYT